MFRTAADGITKFSNIVLLISVLLYFFGMVCVLVLKSCAGKKAVSISYMVMGGIIALLNLALLFVCINDNDKISLVGTDAVGVFLRFIVPTLVFGFYPFIKGITRFIEAEMTPAPVKPAVQPATQPAASQTPAKATTATAAKKPAAKKTTAAK